MTNQRRFVGFGGPLATILFTICLSVPYLPTDLFGTLHAETHMEFEEYVQHYKYPVQRHEVITEDGYILTVFRLQAKHSTEFQQNLPPVYIQHGLLDSSDSFVVNEESKAPAFILANQGFDVWLGNFRGNKHSRSHVKFDADSPHLSEERKFWNFSFHEMGVKDIPAIFEHIEAVTGQSKIHFIGHSQGSMAMFVALAEEHPSVQRLLHKFIALGPIAYIEHVTSIPLKIYHLSLNVFSLTEWLYYFDIYEFIPSTYFTKEIFSRGCNVLPLLCSYAYGFVGSHDPLLDQNDRYDVISAHIPAGTSLKNMMHFHQLITTNEFKRFDYGSPRKNQRMYGAAIAKNGVPPKYDLSKIKQPIAIFLGTEDRLADYEDVMRLKRELTGVSDMYFRQIHSGHTSFMWGKDMSYFQEVIALLSSDSIPSSINATSNPMKFSKDLPPKNDRATTPLRNDPELLL